MTEHSQMSLEEQAEFLTTQWMSVKQLEEAGIPSRKGPFTKREVERIDAAIQAYQEENEMDDERLEDLIHAIQPEKGFWTYIASAVPQRGVKSVYYHVRRSRNSLAKRGKWTPVEDDQLRQAVREHGNDWVTIADMVQRSPADCSDRFRQHIRYKDIKRKGAWSSEEEGQLLHAIEELARKGKTDMSARGFWVSVSNKMGATRTPKQCQSKWTETLQGKIRNEGKARRWREKDNSILICKIDSLNVVNESDIDWKSLSDPTWNMWSGHCLQQKWRSMKIACKLDDSVCHRDAVAHLVAIVALRGQMPKSSTATKTSAPLSPSPPSTGVP